MSLRPNTASLNLFWAIAVGLEDRDWRELSQAERATFLAQARGLRR